MFFSHSSPVFSPVDSKLKTGDGDKTSVSLTKRRKRVSDLIGKGLSCRERRYRIEAGLTRKHCVQGFYNCKLKHRLNK